MLYNNLFLTDLDLLATQLLPVKWRNPLHIAFLKVLIYPFKLQLKRLISERNDPFKNIYKLTHDSRVGRLEKVLNDRFDISDRRIMIGPGNRIQSLYLYTKSEAQQTYLPQYVYTQEEIADRNLDFTVLIPGAVIFNAQELNFLVKYYAPKDKQYKIEIV
tara:strand:- start:2096 stop:2575 length:480 start_codon:yes stop_codon:yes gene_type:complete